MRQQKLNQFVEINQVVDSFEQFGIPDFQSDSEGKFVVLVLYAVFNTKVDNLCVLLVLFRACLFALNVLDVLFNALVDKDFGEIITGLGNVKICAGFEGVGKRLVIVIEVEVQFGQQNSYQRFVCKLIVFEKFLTKYKCEFYMVLMSLAMSVQ
jgi:hypothetical protein